MIVEVSSFLFNTGAVLFALSAATLLVVKYVRIGIVMMLCADAFFGLAMVYPQKVIDTLGGDDGLIVRFMDSDHIKSLIIALLIYILLFYIQYRFFFRDKRKAPPKEAIGSAQMVLDNNKKVADPVIFANVNEASAEVELSDVPPAEAAGKDKPETVPEAAVADNDEVVLSVHTGEAEPSIEAHIESPAKQEEQPVADLQLAAGPAGEIPFGPVPGAGMPPQPKEEPQPEQASQSDPKAEPEPEPKPVPARAEPVSAVQKELKDLPPMWQTTEAQKPSEPEEPAATAPAEAEKEPELPFPEKGAFPEMKLASKSEKAEEREEPAAPEPPAPEVQAVYEEPKTEVQPDTVSAKAMEEQPAEAQSEPQPAEPAKAEPVAQMPKPVKRVSSVQKVLKDMPPMWKSAPSPEPSPTPSAPLPQDSKVELAFPEKSAFPEMQLSSKSKKSEPSAVSKPEPLEQAVPAAHAVYKEPKAEVQQETAKAAEEGVQAEASPAAEPAPVREAAPEPVEETKAEPERQPETTSKAEPVAEKPKPVKRISSVQKELKDMPPMWKTPQAEQKAQEGFTPAWDMKAIDLPFPEQGAFPEMKLASKSKKTAPAARKKKAEEKPVQKPAEEQAVQAAPAQAAPVETVQPQPEETAVRPEIRPESKPEAVEAAAPEPVAEPQPEPEPVQQAKAEPAAEKPKPVKRVSSVQKELKDMPPMWKTPQAEEKAQEGFTPAWDMKAIDLPFPEQGAFPEMKLASKSKKTPTSAHKKKHEEKQAIKPAEEPAVQAAPAPAQAAPIDATSATEPAPAPQPEVTAKAAEEPKAETKPEPQAEQPAAPEPIKEEKAEPVTAKAASSVQKELKDLPPMWKEEKKETSVQATATAAPAQEERVELAFPEKGAFPEMQLSSKSKKTAPAAHKKRAEEKPAEKHSHKHEQRHEEKPAVQAAPAEPVQVTEPTPAPAPVQTVPEPAVAPEPQPEIAAKAAEKPKEEAQPEPEQVGKIETGATEAQSTVPEQQEEKKEEPAAAPEQPASKAEPALESHAEKKHRHAAPPIIPAEDAEPARKVPLYKPRKRPTAQPAPARMTLEPEPESKPIKPAKEKPGTVSKVPHGLQAIKEPEAQPEEIAKVAAEPTPAAEPKAETQPAQQEQKAEPEEKPETKSASSVQKELKELPPMWKMEQQEEKAEEHADTTQSHVEKALGISTPVPEQPPFYRPPSASQQAEPSPAQPVTKESPAPVEAAKAEPAAPEKISMHEAKHESKPKNAEHRKKPVHAEKALDSPAPVTGQPPFYRPPAAAQPAEQEPVQPVIQEAPAPAETAKAETAVHEKSSFPELKLSSKSKKTEHHKKPVHAEKAPDTPVPVTGQPPFYRPPAAAQPPEPSPAPAQPVIQDSPAPAEAAMGAQPEPQQQVEVPQAGRIETVSAPRASSVQKELKELPPMWKTGGQETSPAAAPAPGTPVVTEAAQNAFPEMQLASRSTKAQTDESQPSHAEQALGISAPVPEQPPFYSPPSAAQAEPVPESPKHEAPKPEVQEQPATAPVHKARTTHAKPSSHDKKDMKFVAPTWHGTKKNKSTHQPARSQGGDWSNSGEGNKG